MREKHIEVRSKKSLWAIPITNLLAFFLFNQNLNGKPYEMKVPRTVLWSDNIKVTFLSTLTPRHRKNPIPPHEKWLELNQHLDLKLLHISRV